MSKHLYTLAELETATVKVTVHDTVPTGFFMTEAPNELRRFDDDQAVRVFSRTGAGVVENRYYL